MPRKRELTWQAGSSNRGGRWKKFYQGKAYYFPFGTSKSDQEGYRQALEAWKQKKAEIDAQLPARLKPHQAAYEECLEEWRLAQQWSIENGEEPYVALAREKIAELEQRLSRKAPPPLTREDRFLARFTRIRDAAAALDLHKILRLPAPPEPGSPGVCTPDPERMKWLDGSPERIQEEIWKNRLSVQQRKVVEPDKSLAAQVALFLRAKAAGEKVGAVTAGRLAAVRIHLQAFRDWLGPATSVEAITGKVLSDFHADLLGRIGKTLPSTRACVVKETMSADYARDRMTDVKTFVRWLYETEAIPELPRILANKRALTISKKVASPEVFSIEEIKALLKEANSRTRLYLLLMLNCGMYQKDISDLRKAEVDWTEGRITRKRSKT